MPDQFDVFLSHNSQDKPAVEGVAARLRGRGLTVWLDRDELRPGLPWQEGLEAGILASRSVAVFIGAGGLGAWEGPEMRAFIDRSRRESIPVIPVLLPGCPNSPQLPLFLQAFTWVDLRTGVDEAGLAKLAWGITGVSSNPPRIPFQETPPASRHHLPFPSLGPLFQGREAMLARLREALVRTPAGRATAIAGKAVHGLGGVGKTRLAVEYAWKHAADYTAALFVAAPSPADLRRNLAALCGRSGLDLPEQEAPEEEVREAAVLRWLTGHPGWLLILDNVDSEDAAAAVDGLVAHLSGGHVLLTGRLARWSAEIEAIELDVLTEAAAVRFLLARTQKSRRKTKTDKADAAALAHELGCLPLALEQAGAYIAERRLTLAAYRNEWHAHHDRVLTWFDSRVSHYPASVAVTWQTSFDRLAAPARRLLERLAWLAPDPIPESLLDVPVPDPAEPDPDPHAALAQLATWSLVTRAAETPTFTVHRLVQDVTRRSLGDDPAIVPLVEALRWVNAAFEGEPQDARTWPVLDPLEPHARAVVTYADDAGIAEPTAGLMNNLGQLLDAKARLAEAEPLMRRALDIDEKSFGHEHPDVAIDLNNLAQLLQATNRLAEAEPLMERVVAILEKSLGADHPKVATALNNLAQLLQDTNRLAEAEPLMRRALDIDEKSFGSEHPDIARDLNNLARLLHATNRFAEAEPLIRRALDIDEKSFGLLHPDVARDLNNLALLLKATNRLAEAEPLMRRALDIDEKSFGHLHPRVARDLNNLARLLQATNRLAEAEPLMRRVLVVFLDFTRRTGHEHPHLRAAFGNYRGLLRAMGKTDAEIEAAIEALRRPFGP
ncbi:MAG TPA: tetratricopeptide repeat protein [Thermoanaerobaculia bacterium]|jgi:tetratricopeptide (TPR) repeat protein|nr:tetratricopeptide repeat protein [Thermoanaerobaculia bacterium]